MDEWKCPSCKRWFDGEEEPGVSGACVYCEEAEEWEEKEQERLDRRMNDDG